MTFRRLASDLRDLLLPRACVACFERIPPEEPPDLICPRCRSRLRGPAAPFCSRCQLPLGTGSPKGEVCLECSGWPHVLAAARAATVLCEVSSAVVHALKYRGWAGLAVPMAQRMSAQMPPGFSDPVLVPVPTTSSRSRVRGYNQAVLLAGALSSSTGLPAVEALRREEGRTQVRLGPRERRANVLDAFALAGEFRSRIRGRDVIVIDDVLTTGATASSVALALEAGGARSVGLLVFARSLPFKGVG